MGLTFGQKIDYRTIEFDITHYVKRQDSKENYRNGNQIYVYFIPLLSNHCHVKYLKANILKPIFSEFLFAILPPLSTS